MAQAVSSNGAVVRSLLEPGPSGRPVVFPFREAVIPVSEVLGVSFPVVCSSFPDVE